jgi:DNA-binding CsgD family transcriptional regulator
VRVDGDLARPDDGALLDAAARTLHRDAGIPLVFGGLRVAGAVPITTTRGHRSDRLQKMTISPRRGLGGRSWIARKPLSVDDYGSSRLITHDYDEQILGESISALAVTPIVVRERVRGLLYAGSRDRLDRAQLGELSARASEISAELDIRDQVDLRMQRWRAEAASTAALRAAAKQRLVTIAANTTDETTKGELTRLLARVAEESPAEVLTARQTDVMRLVARGARNDDIARELGLSVVTVKGYLRDAFRRLNARSRLDAVARARLLGVNI